MNTDRPRWHSKLRIEMPSQLDLYEKTKNLQWNATTDIDWSKPIVNFTEASYAPYAKSIPREDFDRLAAERRASTFTQLFFGEQAALALSAQLVNQCDEIEARMCLAGQIIDEARHVEVFGRYLDKLGEKLELEAPIDPMLEGIVHRILDSDFYGEKIVGMQIFLEGIAVGLFQIFQNESPDPLLRDLIRGVLRDESRHAGFGVMYLHDKFEDATDGEKKRTEEFVGDLLRGFGMMMGGGGFMESTFADIRHRLKQIGLDPR